MYVDNKYTYGILWDEVNDLCTRTYATTGMACGIALPDTFLPVHRKMRGCVLADDGTVNYYLHPTNWAYKEDGITASKLDGTDGQVMVEIPKFYYRYSYGGNIHAPTISLIPLDGFKVHEMFMEDNNELNYAYVGAYEASLYDVSKSMYVGGCLQAGVSAVFASGDKSITIATRSGWATNLTIGQELAISGTSNNNKTVTIASIKADNAIIVNEDLTDETAASTVIQHTAHSTNDILSSVTDVLPITGNITTGTRAHFRKWASNRGSGWSLMFADILSGLQLLYLTEYASFNSQNVLGFGITGASDLENYNGFNPIAKTGNGNSVGNSSGCTATISITTGAGSRDKYLKYRGIENPYGNISEWIDGININNSVPYLCNNPANFADDTTVNYTRPKDVQGNDVTMATSTGWQNTLVKCGRAFLPATVGEPGDGSHKITDYYWADTGWRIVSFGGLSMHSALAGFFCLSAENASSYSVQAYGGRLCFRK